MPSRTGWRNGSAERAVRLGDFEAMVRGMAGELPAEYLDGVAEIRVAGATVPHPSRADIFTLGECIPIPTEDGEPGAVQSRIVLYHGSFVALSRQDDEFDWREEAWQTLAHELRHHLEWRARAPALEAFDTAAEANFARHAGEPFDPLFYLDGESPAEGVYQFDDDVFLDQTVRGTPDKVEFDWHGRRYQVRVPAGARLPVFLRVAGVDDPPPGDLTVVLRRRPGLRDLFSRPRVQQHEVHATPLGN